MIKPRTNNYLEVQSRSIPNLFERNDNLTNRKPSTENLNQTSANYKLSTGVYNIEVISPDYIRHFQNDFEFRKILQELTKFNSQKEEEEIKQIEENLVDNSWIAEKSQSPDLPKVHKSKNKNSIRNSSEFFASKDSNKSQKNSLILTSRKNNSFALLKPTIQQQKKHEECLRKKQEITQLIKEIKRKQQIQLLKQTQQIRKDKEELQLMIQQGKKNQATEKTELANKTKNSHQNCIHLRQYMQRVQYLSDQQITQIRTKYQEKEDLRKIIQETIQQRLDQNCSKVEKNTSIQIQTKPLRTHSKVKTQSIKSPWLKPIYSYEKTNQLTQFSQGSHSNNYSNQYNGKAEQQQSQQLNELTTEQKNQRIWKAAIDQKIQQQNKQIERQVSTVQNKVKSLVDWVSEQKNTCYLLNAQEVDSDSQFLKKLEDVSQKMYPHETQTSRDLLNFQNQYLSNKGSYMLPYRINHKRQLPFRKHFKNYESYDEKLNLVLVKLQEFQTKHKMDFKQFVKKYHYYGDYC